MKSTGTRKEKVRTTRMNVDEPESRVVDISYFLEHSPNLMGEGDRARTSQDRNRDAFDPASRREGGGANINPPMDRSEGSGYH